MWGLVIWQVMDGVSRGLRPDAAWAEAVECEVFS